MKKTFFIGCIICFFSCHFNRDSEHLSAISSLPSFDMLLLDSVTLLHAQNISTGKPIVVIYFETDCPHCQAETKNIVDNIDALKNFQVYFLAGARLEDIKGYSEIFNLNKYPNIIIGKDYEHSFARIFKPELVPYIAIYDGEKKLAKIYHGETSINALIAAIHS